MKMKNTKTADDVERNISLSKNVKKKSDSIPEFLARNRYILLTVLLFLMVFAVKVFFALQTPYFANEESYLHLRYAKYISEYGPFSTDHLTYDGRRIPFLSIYDSILASFDRLFDINIFAKILNELISAGFIILVYLISKQISKNEKASFIAALSSSLIPFFTKNTFNSASPEVLELFLIMILLLLFLKIRQNKKLSSLYVFVLVLASSISPMIFIFTISLVVFYIISSAYNITLEKYEKELLLFSLFVSIIIELLFLRETLIQSGFSIIWGNIPTDLFKQIYPELSLAHTAFFLGIVTVIIAFRTTYVNLVRKNNPSFFIIFSIAFTTVLLLWLKILTFDYGILIISIILPIITGYFFADVEEYLHITKISNKTNLIIFSIVGIIIITNIYPTITSIIDSKPVVDKYDITALEWLKDNANDREVVFSVPTYGNIITYFADKKVVANSEYLGIKNINAIFRDFSLITTSTLKTNVIGLLNKYNVTYIVLNKELDPKSFDNNMFNDKCFEESYMNRKIKILKLKCRLE